MFPGKSCFTRVVPRAFGQLDPIGRTGPSSVEVQIVRQAKYIASESFLVAHRGILRTLLSTLHLEDLKVNAC